MKINILYLIERMGPGGTEKQLAALIKGLDRNAFSPFLCTFRPSYSIFDELDIPTQEFHFNKLFDLKTVLLVKELYRFCRKHDIHLIQTYFQDPTLIGALMKLLFPIKLVGSFRDLGFWRTPVENLKMRMAYPAFDGFIANSQSVKKHFCETDRVSSQKVTVIYNGFKERDKKEHVSTESPKGHFTVGIVGNFNRPVKRVQDFIKAAAIVSHEFPNAVFALVGAGTQEPWVMRMTEDLNVFHQMRFVGMVEDALSYIETFDVGVNTSESEGLSNAVIEYMACGIPVVATAVGGNAELIEDPVNGLLYPVGDFKQAAEKMIQLLCNQELRLSMGRKNKEKIAMSFSYVKMIRSHEDYYRKLLDK